VFAAAAAANQAEALKKLSSWAAHQALFLFHLSFFICF
jgi:hypothetical protein